MLARTRRMLSPVVRQAALLALPFLLVGACGDGTKVPEGSASIQGGYALIIGARTTLFSLASSQASVLCRPKPGLRAFEFEATSATGAGSPAYLRFVLADYAGPGDYAVAFEPGGVAHEVEVSFAAHGNPLASYKYKFFQFVRPDLNVTYRTHCDFSIQAETLTGRTRYAGAISCGALWADFDSVDYLSQPLNAFVDMVAKFECEVPS
jgi:hypothetical protein